MRLNASEVFTAILAEFEMGNQRFFRFNASDYEERFLPEEEIRERYRSKTVPREF